VVGALPELPMKKVLVVDDHPHTHRLVEIACGKLGAQWISASDGVAGLAAARAEKPDLILLDVTMPEKNGWEVLRELKSDAEMRAIPVVMLTAQDNEDEIAQALEGGARQYVRKPFHPLEIAGVLEKLLAEAP
jgi:CheY-like chemotaxis protein